MTIPASGYKQENKEFADAKGWTTHPQLAEVTITF
jgi:hypothetical protein